MDAMNKGLAPSFPGRLQSMKRAPGDCDGINPSAIGADVRSISQCIIKGGNHV